MKRMSVLMVAALVLLAWTLTTAADDKTKVADKDDKRADEVKALDAKISDAIMKGDTKFIEQHTADNYMVIDAVGSVWNKQQNLDHLKNNAKFDQIKDSDVKVHFYGDAAVITGLADVKGMVKGKTKMHDISGEYRWTRVYVMKDGRWQCVTEQFTNVYKDKDKK